MKLQNDVNITIKKGYTQKRMKDGKVIPSENNEYHNSHTLMITKEYVDCDDVQALEKAVNDLEYTLNSMKGELDKLKQSREWFKGTDLEF